MCTFVLKDGNFDFELALSPLLLSRYCMCHCILVLIIKFCLVDSTFLLQLNPSELGTCML